MATTDFRLTYASVQLTYPPLSRFRGGQIKDFAAEIDNEHPFETVRVSGDAGGVLETEDRRWFQIERDGLEVQERGVDESWELARKRIVDLVSATKDRFEIPLFLVPEIILRALWPVPQQAGAASDLLRAKALALQEEQYQLLGDEVRGGSITVVGGHTDEPMFNWSVEIAPFLSDENQVWIELETRPMGIGEDGEFLDQALAAAYEFLENNVMTFIATVLT